ncbi:MAG: ABC transporter substrate-binding protein, partial [Flavobacteriales bacterium]|nr:ABC transporter substrate-binding protein [Flavobacteriales bacterium]
MSTYTNSGSAPTKAAARGEIGISVGFMHHMVMLTNSGFPLEIVSPCEGTGYEVGGVSIIKGAKNLEAAKAWVEFAISAPAQSLGRNVGVYNVPSNSNA